MANITSSLEQHRRVAVIGGGITGLAAAYRLHELAVARERPLHVTLFESGTRLGGALETVQRDGYVIETGADSFLSEKPWALDLAERLGLSAEVIGTQAEFRKTLVVRKGRLTQIPEGFALLAPTFIGPMLKSPLFSPAGKLRIMMEPFIPRRQGDRDESLAGFVMRRLGREVLERVAQPLAAGIYTADPAMLSAAATMPRFVEMERRYGSVIRGLRAAALGHNANARGTSGARWSLFVSFKGGVRALVDALRSRLRDSIRSGATAVALERVKNDLDSPGAWRLRLADGSGFDADAIVCAVPAYAAASLLKPHYARLATILERIGYASAATVNLAFRQIDFPHPPTCFGFVVPAAEKRKIIAASFSSLKFAGRAPARMILVRVFLGGALQTEMMALDDAAMVVAAREELASLLCVAAEPRISYVRRWPNAMPQYHVGHLEGVSEIEREAGKIAGFAIAGAFLRGVGIPDCIRSGEAAAETVFSRITNRT